MTLYIIATPIGNLEDITYRAIRILSEADIIAAEDTRQTSKLLKHYSIIYKKIISYNDHNKARMAQLLIGELKKGKSVAVVSDSGTPGINDPGFNLVRDAVKNDITIVPVPGACALINGLVCSGLPTDAFTFYGFFPKKQGKKEN